MVRDLHDRAAGERGVRPLPPHFRQHQQDLVALLCYLQENLLHFRRGA